MTRDTCRMSGCEREPGSKEGYNSRKFCSLGHELKHEHIEADAREARLDAEPEPVDEHPGVAGDFL